MTFNFPIITLISMSTLAGIHELTMECPNCTNILLFGMRAHTETVNEFDIQANVRLVTLNVNNAVRNASGVYVLSKAYPDGSVPLTTYFTEGWNYMMMNADQTALVEWYWDGTQH